MRIRFQFLLPCVLLAAYSTVFAQKPRETHPFEIILAPESEAWVMTGNTRISARTQLPEAVYQANFKVSNTDPESQAREYLTQNMELLGLQEADLQNLKLHKINHQVTGVTVRLRQFWQGLPVNKNAEITIHIDPHNTVTFVQNGYRYGVQLADISPSFSASSAKELIAQRINNTGNISFESNNLMVFNHKSQDYLVHRVVIVADAPVGEWEGLVDAHTGDILQLVDISAYHHHEPAHQEPPAVPLATNLLLNGTGNVFNPDPLSSAAVAYGGSYVDGTDADNASLTAEVQNVNLPDITLTGSTYSLVGPYASILDFEAPNKGTFSQATSTFNFLRSADAFEAVNCYYFIDYMMRYLNVTLGVSVLPYQYTGGVRFDPSGLSGADNSHYISSTGRLAFGEGGVDDAEDSDVIIHELGHGLHDWVTSGGLSQVNGLSEGTGDYWASSYSRSTGTWASSNAAYNWVFNWDGHNPFWNGRVNNYSAVYPGGLVGSIHTDGQIWATAMMKIWDDIGQNKADKIFWLGLDMTNSSSNQNDAANAVYQAALTLGCSPTEQTAIITRFTNAGYTISTAPVPIELVRFDGQIVGDQAQLTWSTASEYNNDYFTVEHSVDGQHFSSLTQVKSKGNSNTLAIYETNDRHPVSGLNYYRLRQTDLSGTATLSKVIALDFSKAGVLNMFPNPATDQITINHTFDTGIITIFDATGRVVFTQTVEQGAAKGGLSINLSELSQGVYWVQLEAAGQLMGQKLLKR